MNSSVAMARVPQEIEISVSRGYFRATHENPKLGEYTIHVRDREVEVEYPEAHAEEVSAAYALAGYLEYEGFKVFCRAVPRESHSGLRVYIHHWLYTQFYEERLSEILDVLDVYTRSSHVITPM